MSEGYGTQIYKKQKKKNFRPYIVIVALVLVLGSSWFFFKSLLKEPSAPVPLEITGENNGEVRDDPQQEAEEESFFETDTQFGSEGGDIPVQGDGNRSGESEGDVSEPSFSNKSDLPGTGGVDLSAAHAFYMNRQYGKALELYEKASLTSDDALAYTGICYYRLTDYPNAESFLERAIKKNREMFLARKFMAFTCYKQDDLESSLLHAEKGLELLKDPELLTLYNKLKRERKTMDGYGEREKGHFKVQFSKEEHGEIEGIVLDILKDAYRTVGREMDFYPPQPITVILYNQKGFFDVTRAPGWAGGLYDGKIRLPIKGMKGREAMVKRILVHEYTHALVRTMTSRVPLWINEGLAEYFSRGAGERKIGQIIPLNYLERRFPSGDARLVGIAYMESYSAVCHLIERHGTNAMKELLLAFNNGESYDSAFESVFYVTYQKFISTWEKKE
ncbi:MAG: hypothetical protein GY765_35900 [bacterium]|nr:hypothetical protein [bacterium]